MKIVILEANSLGADVDLSAFEKLGEVAVYGQSNMQDTPEKIKDADIIVMKGKLGLDTDAMVYYTMIEGKIVYQK